MSGLFSSLRFSFSQNTTQIPAGNSSSPAPIMSCNVAAPEGRLNLILLCSSLSPFYLFQGPKTEKANNELADHRFFYPYSFADLCIMTRMAVLLTKFFYSMWFFGAAYYWFSWIFLAVSSFFFFSSLFLAFISFLFFLLLFLFHISLWSSAMYRLGQIDIYLRIIGLTSLLSYLNSSDWVHWWCRLSSCRHQSSPVSKWVSISN